MSVQAFPFPEHIEQASRALATLTIDPYKNALYYFFPALNAFFTDYQELRVDPGQEAMMPALPTQRMIKEIKDLTECAGIRREVVPYVALNHAFSSCGGAFSLTKPALFLPYQHLFRFREYGAFPQERPADLRNRIWVFSDDETRFLIARELGQIKENSALVRLAIKVAVIGALFVIYASSLGLLGCALFVSVLGIYILSERVFQGRADRIGIEILAKKIGQPVQIAIDVLEKMRQQNLYRREHSKIAKWYITKEGNNMLDLTHPYLTARIKKLRSMNSTV